MQFDLKLERDRRARIDEFAILRYAQHLKAIRGPERAIQVLVEAIRDISSPSIFSDDPIGP